MKFKVTYQSLFVCHKYVYSGISSGLPLPFLCAFFFSLLLHHYSLSFCLLQHHKKPKIINRTLRALSVNNPIGNFTYVWLLYLDENYVLV